MSSWAHRPEDAAEFIELPPRDPIPMGVLVRRPPIATRDDPTFRPNLHLEARTKACTYAVIVAEPNDNDLNGSLFGASRSNGRQRQGACKRAYHRGRHDRDTSALRVRFLLLRTFRPRASCTARSGLESVASPSAQPQDLPLIISNVERSARGAGDGIRTETRPDGALARPAAEAGGLAQLVGVHQAAVGHHPLGPA